MKIVIITDSLGCPRDNVDVESTWVYRFIKEYSSNHVIYTFLEHGLSTNRIKYRTVEQINADIIILQVGIVDCTRRAMSDNTRKFFMKIPGFRTLIHRFAKKNHYLLTKIFSIYKVNEKQFLTNIHKLKDNNPQAEIYAIRIADAGSYMTKKVYNIQNDIDTYNNILEKYLYCINPYDGLCSEDYVIKQDGHHLNEKGNELVNVALARIMG